MHAWFEKNAFGLYDGELEDGRQVQNLAGDEVDDLILRERLTPWPRDQHDGPEPDFGGHEAGPDWFVGELRENLGVRPRPKG